MHDSEQEAWKEFLPLGKTYYTHELFSYPAQTQQQQRWIAGYGTRLQEHIPKHKHNFQKVASSPPWAFIDLHKHACLKIAADDEGATNIL